MTPWPIRVNSPLNLAAGRGLMAGEREGGGGEIYTHASLPTLTGWRAT